MTVRRAALEQPLSSSRAIRTRVPTHGRQDRRSHPFRRVHRFVRVLHRLGSGHSLRRARTPCACPDEPTRTHPDALSARSPVRVLRSGLSRHLHPLTSPRRSFAGFRTARTPCSSPRTRARVSWRGAGVLRRRDAATPGRSRDRIDGFQREEASVSAEAYLWTSHACTPSGPK